MSFNTNPMSQFYTAGGDWTKDPADWWNTYASNQAQQAYQNAMLANQGDYLALAKAQQAWKETMDRAGLTGYFEGQATVPFLSNSANMFGTWGAPQQGQQTLGAQQQQFMQAYQNAQLYGQAYTPGGAGPTAGQQTLAGQQQQWQQGMAERQFQNQQQQQQQQNAQAYLQLLSQLRGPADWAKYQQVLGATPGGMRDLAAAAMGQYVPGGGATTGVQPQAVSLQTMQQQIAGQGGYGGYQSGQGYAPGALAQNEQAQAGAGWQRGAGGQQASGEVGPMAQVWGSGIGTGQQQATPAQQQQATGNGTNLFGNLPAPNQIAAQSWKNMAPSQREMLLGQYESQGWHKPDVEALMNQALPRYASNAPTAGTWRLAA